MDIVLRATVMFFILFLLIRLLGKRELGQMTPFEFVVLVVLGDLIQQGVTHNDFSLTGATLAICTFAFWALVLSWTAYLFPRAKNLLEGTPRVQMQIQPEVDGGIGTIAMCVNMIPHVINARPGLKTMIDLPVPHAIMGDFRDQIEDGLLA